MINSIFSYVQLYIFFISINLSREKKKRERERERERDSLYAKCKIFAVLTSSEVTVLTSS